MNTPKEEFMAQPTEGNGVWKALIEAVQTSDYSKGQLSIDLGFLTSALSVTGIPQNIRFQLVKALIDSIILDGCLDVPNIETIHKVAGMIAELKGQTIVREMFDDSDPNSREYVLLAYLNSFL